MGSYNQDLLLEIKHKIGHNIIDGYFEDADSYVNVSKIKKKMNWFIID